VEPEDVNGDGKVDVILYNSTTGTEYTGISNGDGTFNYTYQYWGIGKNSGEIRASDAWVLERALMGMYGVSINAACGGCLSFERRDERSIGIDRISSIHG
jgi:hypothetical protein